VLGDRIYGGGECRLHLLARAIALDLDPPVMATAPVPSHMAAAIAGMHRLAAVRAATD
jgi:tRNA pseudouridine32 synthase / 23S rRNA pseudouridine746 synthase